METGQSRKGEATMTGDDAGKEPSIGLGALNVDELATHRLENEAPPPPPPRRVPHPYAPLVVPILLAAVLNVIFPATVKVAETHIRPGEIVLSFLAGIVVGELGLLATWAVLGPWRLYAQWFAVSLLWLVLFMMLMLGGALVHDLPPNGNEFLQITFGYSAAFVAAQAPLWFIRLLRGWRLVLRGAETARTAIESRQMQIRDILIAMTMLAVFLGTMNLVAKGGHGRDSVEFPFIVLCICGVAVVWSALVLPICLWVCFGASAIRVRIASLVGYLIAAATIAVCVTVAVSRRILPTDEVGFFMALHVALFATLLSGLWLARTCGYVLISVRSTRRGQALVGDNQGAA
jgi:hypothetical protein